MISKLLVESECQEQLESEWQCLEQAMQLISIDRSMEIRIDRSQVSRCRRPRCFRGSPIKKRRIVFFYFALCRKDTIDRLSSPQKLGIVREWKGYTVDAGHGN